MKRKLGKYKTRCSRLKRKGTNVKQPSKMSVMSMLKKYLTPLGTKLIAAQLENNTRKKCGQRWCDEIKSLALQIKGASPKAYKIISKVFSLPSIRLLNRLIFKINIRPGFHLAVLHALQQRASSFTAHDKYVVLTFDEMSLKENVTYNISTDSIEGYEYTGEEQLTERLTANHAGVFMVRSMYDNWKQPFGYFLTHGTMAAECLQKKIIEAINHLQDSGLTTKVLVCDQGSNNRSAVKRLGVTAARPYFHVNDEKIFFFYDSPHLMKNIRGNFKSGAFTLHGQPVEWEHIKELYDIDSKKKIRMVPKLTAKHVQLPPFSSMSVPLAAQLLSHSVAAALSTLADLGRIEKDAHVTAEFIDNFDKLFDTFNSSQMHDTHPYKQAMKQDTDHIAFLKQMQMWLNCVNVTGRHKELPCLEGWKLNINSLLQLWDYMKSVSESYILTRRLNQDCLEHFFGSIRGKGGHRDNPDPCHFRLDYRQATIEKLIVFGNNTNCEVEDVHLLLTLSNLYQVI